MDNHYHLLLSTPEGNLNRVMRHINGVYTQRYNRLEKTDGPLFRGRYKAILVDADAYLLCVSRYIHLNPVAAGIVKKAHQYRWSSYCAYIGKVVPPTE
jgi:putative transposase